MPRKSFAPTRERKQKHRKQSLPDPTHKNPSSAGLTTITTSSGTVDPNASILLPRTAAEKKAARDALLAKQREQAPAMSSKKKKRLDKYIENKMRKEETVALIAKLAAEEGGEGASGREEGRKLLQSMKMLGAPRESRKQRARRALMEERLGVRQDGGEEVYTSREVQELPQDMKKGQDGSGMNIQGTETNEDVEMKGEDQTFEEPEVKQQAPSEPPGNSTALVGSGLKRPLTTGEDGRPVIKRIKREKKRRPVVAVVESESSDSSVFSSGERSGESRASSGDEQSEEEWKGFSDSDKEGSSDEEEDSSDESMVFDSDTEQDEKSGRLKRGQSEKANAFKEWAIAQRNAVMDRIEESTISNIEANAKAQAHIVHVPRKRYEDMTPPPEVPTAASNKKTYYVTVKRSPEVQAARAELPVFMEEQQIMEAINNHHCVVIHGETGSGKTTQVPQFLYEAGYGAPGSDTPGLIGVTQPRRVAAQAMAKRVGEQLGEGDSEKVSYQIRFDGTVGPKTTIKFMTDGVLLRELAEDFSLKKYSAIIVDEAHERSINTDILIGVVSRVLKLRESMGNPLKLVIMSATLRVSDFTENKILFQVPPPLLTAEGRQFTVTNHFSRRTHYNYIDEAYKKVCKIHRQLPPGGVLVFLTGQNEISTLQKKLQNTFPGANGAKNHRKVRAPKVHISAKDAVVETEDMELGDADENEKGNSSEDDFSDEDEDLGVEIPDDMPKPDAYAPLHVLPLYSLLPNNEQMKIFDPPPEGSRLCVLATNVAETSLTIPGISYVVDCGRSKERNYDKDTGVQNFSVQWTSKASADQRSGRAGRTGPGHCYRLYSSAVFESQFQKFSTPEILRVPIEGLVLQMKSMSIDTIVNFPFPTPPDRTSLLKAEKLLSYLGAIKELPEDESANVITDLGKAMSSFPVSPRFGKVLILGRQGGCLPYVVAIVAALSVNDIFIPEHQLDIAEEKNDSGEALDNSTLRERTARANRRKAYYRSQAQFSAIDSTCDALKLLAAVCAFEYSSTGPESFCNENFIRLKAMQETRKLRKQLTNIVNMHLEPAKQIAFQPQIPPPSKEQVVLLKQVVAAGFIDNLAIRADLVPNTSYPPPNRGSNTGIPYFTLFPTSVEAEEEVVFIHPSSVLASRNNPPQFVVYSELTRAEESGRVRMKPLTPIGDFAVAKILTGTGLLGVQKPVKIWVYEGAERRVGFTRPVVGVGVGRKALGWPLLLRKVTQVKKAGRWVVEKVEAVDIK